MTLRNTRFDAFHWCKLWLY